MPVSTYSHLTKAEKDFAKRHPYSAQDFYLDSLNALRSKPSPRTPNLSLVPDALRKLNVLFASRGAYDLAMELLTELLAWADAHEDRKRVMQAWT